MYSVSNYKEGDIVKLDDMFGFITIKLGSMSGEDNSLSRFKGKSAVLWNYTVLEGKIPVHWYKNAPIAEGWFMKKVTPKVSHLPEWW